MPREEYGPQPLSTRAQLSRALARLQDEIDLLRLENEQLLESQRRLESERDFYAGIYQSSPIAGLVLDRYGVVRLANEATVELLQLSPQNLIGLPFRGQVRENDRSVLHRHLELCARMAGREAAPAAHSDNMGGVVYSELTLAPRGRLPFPVALWSAGLDEGEPLYPSALVDITERVAASAERSSLEESERAARAESEAKEQFIATLSHELRTPLTPVLAAVSALTGRDRPVSPNRQVLEMIQRNVVAEARLIDDLLDAARIRRGKLRIDRQPMDVHEAVRQALDVLAPDIQRKGLDIQVELGADRHHASGDLLRLRQVFWNLLGNAIKFTPEGGTIAARSWNRDLRLAVEISDTGPGLPADALERLFRPFEQASPEGDTRGGLGLGLAIARGVMDLHGGEIVARSEGPGRGSRFIVEIETIAAPALPAAQPARAAEPPGGHRRILLIEDHADTADSLAELLAQEGFEVEKVASAASALAVDLDRVDLVVSDLGLPDRSGHELMRELRARRRLPAIALSGYGTESDVRASREAGFGAHLTKPVDWQALLAAIHRVGASRT